MIISKNNQAKENEFQALIENATKKLNEDAKKRVEYYKSRSGVKLEIDVLEILNETAKGTVFEGTIKQVSSQRFPDIIAGNYYGVEVKTTKANNWLSTGSSIMESTRIESVERIYLLFGKLREPIKFKVKPYEDCLSEIVVTHSPRYKIDMQLNKSETIFEKMGVEYDEFRKSNHSIELVKEYYRKHLKPNENLWWIDSKPIEEQVVSPIIKMWKGLEQEEKNALRVQGFCWFPEIFGNSSTKYDRLALWLVTQKGIVTTSLRDIYSAGGRADIETDEVTWENQSQIFYKMATLRNEIKEELLNATDEWIGEFWGVNPVKQSDRIYQWIEQVLIYIGEDKKGMLYSIFKL